MQTFPLNQALRALEALRTAAGLAPEQFPVQAFVGMISDEIDTLRTQGKTDADIAQIIAANSDIRISPQDIGEHYATPDQRNRPE